MPLLKNRSEHTKVYRPNGTRYAEGRSPIVGKAVALAMAEFLMEFGSLPRQDETNMEILGVTGEWVCIVFEIKEPHDAIKESARKILLKGEK